MSRSGCPVMRPFSFECDIAVIVYANPSVKRKIPKKNRMLGFRLMSSIVTSATLAATEYLVTRNLTMMYLVIL